MTVEKLDVGNFTLLKEILAENPHFQASAVNFVEECRFDSRFVTRLKLNNDHTSNAVFLLSTAERSYRKQEDGRSTLLVIMCLLHEYSDDLDKEVLKNLAEVVTGQAV